MRFFICKHSCDHVHVSRHYNCFSNERWTHSVWPIDQWCDHSFRLKNRRTVSHFVATFVWWYISYWQEVRLDVSDKKAWFEKNLCFVSTIIVVCPVVAAIVHLLLRKCSPTVIFANSNLPENRSCTLGLLKYWNSWYCFYRWNISHRNILKSLWWFKWDTKGF